MQVAARGARGGQADQEQRDLERFMEVGARLLLVHLHISGRVGCGWCTCTSITERALCSHVQLAVNACVGGR